jgi:acetyltransferase-like isoleucine patch superfamily enzyme
VAHTVHSSFEDPISIFPRIISKLNSLWLQWTYPFASVGSDFWAHYSAEIPRSAATHIKIGNSVRIDPGAWINIPLESTSSDLVIVLDDACSIGRRVMISAKNQIHLEHHTILSPSVLIMDHNHAFQDVTLPIDRQGVTSGGTIRIEEGCWIGFGAAIICSQGELVIGRNSVVGANAVVTRSVPPYSVVAGNPSKIVKRFDAAKGEWVRTNSSSEESVPAAKFSQAR